MKFSLLAIVMLSVPPVALSQTLCRAGEIDYFSCKTTANGKTVSVCGNIANNDIDDESWLQYRFGRVGAIELAYPSETHGSVAKFDGNYFNRLGVVDLRFIRGQQLYSVELVEAYSGDEAQQRNRPSGGVSVMISKTRQINVFCQKVDISKYFDIYRDLNNAIRAHKGGTDPLYQFYNRVSK